LCEILDEFGSVRKRRSIFVVPSYGAAWHCEYAKDTKSRLHLVLDLLWNRIGKRGDRVMAATVNGQQKEAGAGSNIRKEATFPLIVPSGADSPGPTVVSA
jgi:hypothetical protein